MKDSLNLAIEKSIRANWKRKALSNLNAPGSYTYSNVARQIECMHIYFRMSSVHAGDKIALCAPNSAEWAIAFFGIITYGAVAVPLLNDFTPADIQGLVTHSDSVILFTTKNVWNQLDVGKLPKLKLAICLDESGILYSSSDELLANWQESWTMFEEKYPDGFQPDNIRYFSDKPGEPVLINYTSGSTGNPKGVIVPRRALMSNLRFACDHMPYLHAGDGILSMLPMAHMYGLLVEVIFPFAVGANIRFLGRIPSPQILLSSFAKVKPKLIITVPLVIEKLIIGRVFPLLKKPLMKFLFACPFVNILVRRKLRKKLLDVFGGNVHEMIIGGSGLNPEVESFLEKIKFPFTVGYGMTECAPLIAYAPWNNRSAGSCGRIVDRMEYRIDSPDPLTQPGELSVKGDNVMIGYYRNPEATANVLASDGWMKTGDMVQTDKSGLMYIRGRNKTMILGPSGQNIYPEEIEAIINRLPLMGESLLVARNGRLVALLVPDADKIKEAGLNPEQVEAAMNENLSSLNSQLPQYSKVSQIEIMDKPFEKTPKHSIKRFLYS